MSVFGGCVGRMDAVIETVYGDSVTYHPSTGADYAITGVLDSGTPINQGERAYQTFWAPLANFTHGEPTKADRVVIGSNTYRVADVEKQHLDGRLLKLVLTTP